MAPLADKGPVAVIPQPQRVKPRFPRFVYLVVALLQAWLVSGTVFGFFNLVPRMTAAGVFADQCDGTADADGTCDEQAAQFGLVFTLASSLAFVAPLAFGLLMDRVGPRVSTVTGMVCALAGSGLVAASDPAGDFQAYLPGFGCIGLASSVMLGSLHVSNLFQGREHTVLAVLNGVFDAAAFVFFFVALLPAAWSLSHIFWAHAAIVLALLVVGVLVWPSKPFAQRVQPGVSVAKVVPAGPQVPAHAQAASVVAVGPEAAVGALPASETGAPDVKPLTSARDPGGVPCSDAVVAAPLNALSFTQQAQTFEYIGASIWFCAQQLRFTFHLASLDEQLNQLGQRDAEYTRLFGLVLPFGFLANVGVGWLSDRHGVNASLLATTIAGLVTDVLRAALPLEAQVVAFASFAVFRAFLFATTASYLSHTFGFATLGTTIGVTWCTAGLVSLSQYPLVEYSVTAGSFVLANLAMVALGALSVTFPLTMLLRRQPRHAPPSCMRSMRTCQRTRNHARVAVGANGARERCN